ncbi:MAG: CheR family methyltransferase [Chloroflexota bacterium]
MGKPENEFTLTQKDYERFRDLVQERSGLYFPQEKRAALIRGLAEAMAIVQNGVSPDSYYRLLSVAPSASREWDQLISVLTVGETYFFRNKGHFDALRDHILPRIIKQRYDLGRRIRIWSAGCASGEEPYSVAILLRELIPDIESWRVLILATDINQRALELAHQGLYGSWSFRGVDPRIRETYFRRWDKDRYQIVDEIKTMVTFDYLNLVEDQYPSFANNTCAMDVILCRNVTIYFSQEVTGRVVKQFHQCLTDDGWFIPGASEPNMVNYQVFEHQSFPGAVVYQKSRRQEKPAIPTAPVSWQPSIDAWAPKSQARKPAATPAVPVWEGDGKKDDACARALQLIRQGQNLAALNLLQEIVAQDPECAPAYLALGRLHADKGEWETAQRWCEKAIEKDSLNPEPYFTLAMIAWERENLDEAVSLVKKTLYLDPLFILGHYALANIHRQQGKEEMARRSLQNVRRLLVGRPPEEPISGGDGLVVGRLLAQVEAALGA